MSEAPQGPSWFQATDGKWYPPPEGQQNLQSGGQTNPVLPARKRYPLVLGIAIPILIVSLIAGFAVARMLSSDDEATAVVVAEPGEIFLEPAAEIGADPFAPTPFAPPPDPALARPVGAAPVTTLPATTAAVQAYSGAQPGLYGGTRENAVCNVQQMIDYLVANPSIAGAWVVAQNADPTLRFDKGVLTVADLPAYIATLTPLILLQDTRVTMSGYKNGQPTPHQSVLQKGGAVLVDKYGVPRAKCYCGNPLTAPQPTPVAPIYVGPAWPDFNPAVVAVVTPSPNPINIFVTINIVNGQTYNVPAGNNAAVSAPATVPDTQPATPAGTTSDAEVITAFEAAIVAGDRNAAAALAPAEALALFEPFTPRPGVQAVRQGGGVFTVQFEPGFIIGCNVGNGQVLGCAQVIEEDGEGDDAAAPPTAITSDAEVIAAFEAAIVAGDRNAADALAPAEALALFEPFTPRPGVQAVRQGGGVFTVQFEPGFIIGCNVGNGRVLGCAQVIEEEDEAAAAPSVPDGVDIAFVQTLLNVARAGSLDSDGVFGPASTAATSKFQRSVGMAETGVVDDATWQALLITTAEETFAYTCPDTNRPASFTFCDTFEEYKDFTWDKWSPLGATGRGVFVNRCGGLCENGEETVDFAIDLELSDAVPLQCGDGPPWMVFTTVTTKEEGSTPDSFTHQILC
jgi:hypothetical protein